MCLALALLPGQDERKERDKRRSVFFFFHRNRNEAGVDEEKGVMELT